MEINEKNGKIYPENFGGSDFLQSQEWLKFQENAGKKTFQLKGKGFSANIIEHELPIVGKYFYCPHGPGLPVNDHYSAVREGMARLVQFAKRENAGWIRIEPVSEDFLGSIRQNVEYKTVKAPHDMQPREIFMIDISKSEEELLSEMKPKTRYNVGIARKKNVFIRSVDKLENTNYVEEFLRLTSEMAARQGISTHSREYYKKMIESLPKDMLKLYVAEFEGKIVAANLVLFHGNTATYLHGASGNECRNLMAPYLLQWQSILDAREKGYKYYDLGGISTRREQNKNWQGITKFKLGFSPSTNPVVFPGSYDIILNPAMYIIYRILQKIKSFI